MEETQKPTDKSDIFAVGIILHQMLTNKHPFGSGNAKIIFGIRDHQPEALPSHISAFTKDLVSLMLEKDPAKRPDALTLL